MISVLVEIRREETETEYLLSIFHVPGTVISIFLMFSHLILIGTLHIIIISTSQKRRLKLRGINLLKVTKLARGGVDIRTHAI